MPNPAEMMTASYLQQSQSTQAPSQMNPLLDALSHAIMGTLNQPSPQAPQMPTPQGLGPIQAAAGAMNPGAIPLLMQQANAPANTFYANQQAAFEGAMKQRRDALQAGTQLVGRDITGMYGLSGDKLRADATMNRPVRPQQGRLMKVKGPNGEPVIQEFIPNGAGGFDPGNIVAAGTETLKYIPTPDGYVEAGSSSGPTGNYLPKPGGGNALPPPPAGTVSDVAAGTATLAGLDQLKAAYTEIRTKTANQSFPEQVGKNFVGESRYGGAFGGTKDYAIYVSNRRAALNAYIKSVTGAQFSVAELQRYDSQFPEPWDDETLADSKIASLKQRATADMQAKMRAFPAATPAGPAATATPDIDPAIIQRARELRDKMKGGG